MSVQDFRRFKIGLFPHFSIMSLLLLWIGSGIVFLIIEIVTSTFYGLALAVAAFAVAAFLGVFPEENLSIVQGIIFVAVSLTASYLLPKYLSPKEKEKPQGLDIYLGEVRRVERS